MRRWKLVSPFTVMLLAALGFAGLSALTTLDWTAAMDRAVLQGLRGSTSSLGMAGPSWPMEFVRDLTSLAGVGIVLVVSVFVVIYQLIGGAWRASLVTVIVIGGTQLCTDVLKQFVSRPRPDLVEHGAQVFTHSYPSGHAGMAAAVALTLAWYAASRHAEQPQRIYCWIVGVGAVLIIGLTRVYLGVHWLSDVLAGWCVGTFWAAVGYAVARQLTGMRSDPRRSA